MKLNEIKNCLIEQFFTEESNGVSLDKLDSIFESMGNHLKIDLSAERLASIHSQTNQSSDVGKAFRKFTDGRVSILTIVEEFDSKTNAIFTAIRSGTSIIMSDLTSTIIVEKNGALLAVKNALKQAKNRNDEIFFNITSMNTK